MAVATETARAWKAATAQGAVPEVPEPVQRRFEAVWAATYVTARAKFEEARTGWDARARRLEEEFAELIRAEAEAERVSAGRHRR